MPTTITGPFEPVRLVKGSYPGTFFICCFHEKNETANI